MIRISAGTSHQLGYRKINTDVLPTTAYLLTGEKCFFNCGFCPQSQKALSPSRLLSRITWQNIELEDMARKIGLASADERIKRVCLQVVSSGEPILELRNAANTIKRFADVPLCVSVRVKDVNELKYIAASGFERISIPLDAASPRVFRETKGGSWQGAVDMLFTAADLLPGQISTHLIVGLGETEEEMACILQQLHDRGVSIGLFAFTPVPGTPMAGVLPPDIASYRRIQAFHYLVKEELINVHQCKFSSGKLTGYGITRAQLKKYLGDGAAFRTSGCPDCNRPYYNEKPGSVPYNYPRALTPDEITAAVNTVLQNLNEELHLNEEL
ncbi:MAG: radical SAM protein [Thermincola sp.]|jgi:biotin synthase|nr:radical SAM protein [Thermincola sp.]MDT3702488.1 radical SAM protein [Thermincola sp.]